MAPATITATWESASPSIGPGSYYIYVQAKDLLEHESTVTRNGPIVQESNAPEACTNAVGATGFNGGDGTASTPYLICTYAQLEKMGDDLDAHYRLAQNIDASGSWSAGSEKDASADGDTSCTAFDGLNEGEGDVCTGWSPVGSETNCDTSDSVDDTCFQGQLDGNGFLIEKLYVNTTGSGTQYGGLFGVMGEDARISRLGLIDIEIVTNGVPAYAGGLAGHNAGDIEESYMEGKRLRYLLNGHCLWRWTGGQQHGNNPDQLWGGGSGLRHHRHRHFLCRRIGGQQHGNGSNQLWGGRGLRQNHDFGGLLCRWIAGN